MAIQLNEENNGKLVKDDYTDLVPDFERLVQQHGTRRVLFDLNDFHGWETGAAWEDFKFGVDHFYDIERMAIVGENKWQAVMPSVAKPFTNAQVRYFDHTKTAKARQWLGEV